MYKDTPKFRLFIYRQFSHEYGELISDGEYAINERVTFADGRAKGVVAWKYLKQDCELVYVLEDYSGCHFEVTAREIISKA
ncbi:hypothetical protein [Tengunoibacter tsumagoiensis]|uniref:Uncharacterized protein n=1 Tax=Tengunoibacter tsumagoiensis TaxID=2014871 RepID=A0A402A5S2_9CHLR|nr:hypothetical protein [Tengunoibacter tsumagoiensis]GCE14493.1 hypothetical protein KTT_43520 [Tengunoibacter tsumagoiensis]